MYFLKKVYSLFKVYGLCQEKKKGEGGAWLNVSNSIEYASRSYIYALHSYAIFSVLHYDSCNLSSRHKISEPN